MKSAHIYAIIMFFLIFSCRKEKPSDTNTCKDELFNNKELRMNGVWESQSNSNVFNPHKIEFINDSIIKLLPLAEDTIWQVIKFQIHCNAFEYDKYWITDPGPFQNWSSYNSSYDPFTQTWVLSRHNFFTKLIDSVVLVKK